MEAVAAKTQERKRTPGAPRTEPSEASSGPSGASAGVPLFLRRATASPATPSADAELTAAASAVLPAGVVVGRADDPAEREAESAADAVVASPSAASPSPAPPPPAPVAAAPTVAPPPPQAAPPAPPPAAATKAAAPAKPAAAPTPSAPAAKTSPAATAPSPAATAGPAASTEAAGPTETPAPAAAPSSPAHQAPSTPAGGPQPPSGGSGAAGLPGQGPGVPLSPRVREALEPRFGTDLSRVRVHGDQAARALAEWLNARAFAFGEGVWLGPGASDDDVGLLAHEIAHIIQAGGLVIRRAPADGGAAAPPAPGGAKGKGGSKGKKGEGAPAGAPGAAPQGAAGPAAPAPAEAPAAAPAAVEMHMPEPAAELSREERARLGEVKQNAAQTSAAEADLPPAEAQTQDARAAVTEPAAETQGKAEEGVVDALAERQPPSPEIEAFCDRIYAAIRAKRPPDEDSLVDAKPQEAADAAGSELSGNVQGDTQRVQGSYDELGQAPTGSPEQTAEPLPGAPPADAPGAVPASQASPDAVPPEEVSLDADVADSQQKMEDAGMETEPAKLVQEGPIAEAREAHGQLGEMAAKDPQEVLAEQAAALGKAQEDMAALQASAYRRLAAARDRTTAGTGSQQQQMVGSEEQMREQAGTEARRIFGDAQTQVKALLDPLPRTAMAKWEAGKKLLSTEFEQHLARVKKWIDDRHSGIGGAIVGAWDYVTGLPDWVVDEYDAAEKTFGDGVCDLIREISSDVNTVVASCDAIVDDARKQISDLFAKLPASLQEWAQGEQARLGEQLDGLAKQAHDTRDHFNKDLIDRAGHAVQEAREKIHTLRQAAGGLLGKIVDAIGRFLDDPVKFIIDGLLSLVGIDPGAFWALVARIQQVIADIADDPVGFANNLLAGISQGFSQFFDNFGQHLVDGFFDWLFSGLGSVGVTIPTEFSLKSIITFALQLMGITWDRVRRLLAKHIGEKNVALLEKAFELVSTLIEKGPEGIFEMLKDKLDPKKIIDEIIQAGIKFLVEALIKQVAVRLIAMLNPAGAILQAIEAIYRVLKWVFENAARIFSLIEAVVNGAAQVVAGNIAGLAATVEGALAKLIAPVIDFLADYIGLGDLPEKIADVIRGFQQWVEGILDTVIGFLADKAKGLLAALGIGGKDKPAGAGDDAGELGETETFSGGGESHRLWVQTSGDQATIMVASDPAAVSAKLADWKGKADSLPVKAAGGKQPRKEAKALLSDAATLNSAADHEADALKAAIAKHAGPAPAPAGGGAGAGGESLEQKDDVLEAKERALAAVIAKLFDLFGGGGKAFEPIVKDAPMDGGKETVSITPQGQGLALEIAGGADRSKLVAVAAGPLATAKSKGARNAVQDLIGKAKPLEDQVKGAVLLDGKLEENAITALDTEAQAVASALSKLGTELKVPGLERLTRVDPMSSFTLEFYYTAAKNKKYKGFFSTELQRQLDRQQKGLNQLTIEQWTVNIHVYSLEASDFEKLDEGAREAVLADLRERATDALPTATSNAAAYRAAIREIDAALAAGRTPKLSKIEIVAGRFGDETEWARLHEAGKAALYAKLKSEDDRWKKISKTLDRIAVLHNPDQVAGGPGEIPDVPIPPSGSDTATWEAYVDSLRDLLGSKRVNSAIGAAWPKRVDILFEHVKSDYAQGAWPLWQLNVVLTGVEQ